MKFMRIWAVQAHALFDFHGRAAESGIPILAMLFRAKQLGCAPAGGAPCLLLGQPESVADAILLHPPPEGGFADAKLGGGRGSAAAVAGRSTSRQPGGLGGDGGGEGPAPWARTTERI